MASKTGEYVKYLSYFQTNHATYDLFPEKLNEKSIGEKIYVISSNIEQIELSTFITLPYSVRLTTLGCCLNLNKKFSVKDYLDPKVASGLFKVEQFQKFVASYFWSFNESKSILSIKDSLLSTTQMVTLFKLIPDEIKKKTMTLDLSNSLNLEEMPVLTEFPILEHLSLKGSFKLSNILMLSSNIKILNISGTKVKNLDALNGAEQLKKLNADGCCNLTNIEALKNLEQLESLNLSKCILLQSLSSIEELKNLKELDLSHLPRLRTTNRLKGLCNLVYLNLSHTEVTHIRDLKVQTVILGGGEPTETTVSV